LERFFNQGLTVVWKDIRIENEGVYRLGVNFVDISAEGLTLLRDFLNNLMALKASQELIASTGKFSTY
jgi:hypothetical protein